MRRMEVVEVVHIFILFYRKDWQRVHPWGISFSITWGSFWVKNGLPFVELIHEFFVGRLVIILKLAIFDRETVLIESDFADVSIFWFLLLLKFFWSSRLGLSVTCCFFRLFPWGYGRLDWEWPFRFSLHLHRIRWPCF